MTELMGNLNQAVPIMIVVIVSYATSVFIDGESYFGMLGKMEGLDLQV
jgi:H+/Cl- antiporter ClcA